MGLYDSNVMQASDMKLSWLANRQRVIDQNIANVDTPKYKAKDLEAFDFKTSLQHAHLQLATTSPEHFKANIPSASFDTVKDTDPTDVKPNGNSVVLDKQLKKLSDISSNYNLMSSIVNKYRTMYNLSIK